jgi:hypothetical protein
MGEMGVAPGLAVLHAKKQKAAIGRPFYAQQMEIAHWLMEDEFLETADVHLIPLIQISSSGYTC